MILQLQKVWLNRKKIMGNKKKKKKKKRRKKIKIKRRIDLHLVLVQAVLVVHQTNRKKEQLFINVPTLGNSQIQRQQPAFVKYSTPVVIPHIDSQYRVVIEKPVKVIDVEKFEEMWSKKMKQIDELFNEKFIIQTKDENESQNLELRGGRSSSSSSSDKEKNNEEIYKLQFIIGEKDKEIYQARQLIEKLQEENLEYSQRFETMTEEIKTLQTANTYEVECSMWKKKFKALNDTYHACQEKLMVKEAEYESLLKSQSSSQKIVTQTTVNKQGTSTRLFRNESEMASSLIQNDFEKLKAQQKTVMM